ncbi:hypothetical protein BOTBODRAFT_640610 [Botryobasidium botryosum FD-172 SS1]|uniref:tRNA-dihydrouridine(16/17) synthase [NAD(P)(+)] n=1 Tax=Botryobasidium botryosum (strain FD-172 SS1) TaxID=930990 RepID=A0A067ME67_BOTB1|nr:hypothetical protein BOTBODRAFT_640610 [Botryobasidium botryosum FD-172 SS1]
MGELTLKYLPSECLAFVTAPMVNQSDLPFRILARKYGATLTYTQMYLAENVVRDDGYRRAVLSDLESGTGESLARPVVVQLAGNDPGILVQAALMVQDHCDAIDLNLGCPQQRAMDGHYGGYLLGKRDWPLVESIVKALVAALSIPVHVKIRLCSPASVTPELAVRLARAGASVVTLHARHVAARRRRKGPAELHWVGEVKRELTKNGLGHVKVLSNGNVRTLGDCEANLRMTGADGVMVGEAILGNPRLFDAAANTHPRNISLEYLDLCRQHPGTAPLPTVKQHIKYFFSWDIKHSRSTYANVFFAALEECDSDDAIELLLNKVELISAWGSGDPLLNSQPDTTAPTSSAVSSPVSQVQNAR